MLGKNRCSELRYDQCNVFMCIRGGGGKKAFIIIKMASKIMYLNVMDLLKQES